MITWRNRRIEDLTAPELRLALEDAATEIVRARLAFGSDQVTATLLAGFIAGSAMTALAMALPHLFG